MLQKVEAQKQQDTIQEQDSIIESNTTLSPSSSSSSMTDSNNSSLDNVVELPTRKDIMAAKEALDNPESPQQLNLVLKHGLEAAPAPSPTSNTNAPAASTTL